MKVYTSFARVTRNYTHHLHLLQVYDLHLPFTKTCHHLHLPQKVYTPFAPVTRKYTHHLHLLQESIHIICTYYKEVYTSFAPATRKYTSFAPSTRKYTHHLHLLQESIHNICTCYKEAYPLFAPATRKYASIAPATRKYTYHVPSPWFALSDNFKYFNLYQLRSAYTGNKISNQSHVLAVTFDHYFFPSKQYE